MTTIKPREATAIINALIGGVVPKIGIQHITVGRSGEIDAIISDLENAHNGHSAMRFWIGEYGSGKSFILHLINTIALKKDFVVTNADLSTNNNLYSNKGKSVSLFSSLMENLSVKTKPDGGALEILLEKWIEQIIVTTANSNNIPVTQIRDQEFTSVIYKNIFDAVGKISNIGGFDFANVLIKYYEGYLLSDESLKRNALKWLKGKYTTKTEANKDLGVRSIIDDHNYYDMLINFSELFLFIGYSGFVINLDEAVSLYKLSTYGMRLKNYDKILSIYNDCFQGRISNFYVNIAGTPDFLEDERRGLYSYNALKTRLERNKFETLRFRDFAQPVIYLMPLDQNEIFVLLKKVKEVFDFNYKIEVDVSDSDIKEFMEITFNKIGASEFLTPRELIKEFLNVLSILRQNPEYEKRKLFDVNGLNNFTDNSEPSIQEL